MLTQHCGDYFAVYTNGEPCCTSETNILLHVNRTTIFKNENVETGQYAEAYSEWLFGEMDKCRKGENRGP